ncbi:MAG: PD-(D/E)XK nuclease family protein [Patescibacteria group bacterium]
MSKYYQGKRTTRLFDPKSTVPFKLSRSKIDSYIRCPRCFYIDVRLGVGQPPSFPFTLNSAVDLLLKKEFDLHRAKGEPHPLMSHYGVDAIPYQHADLNKWRDALHGGIEYLHQPTNLIISGGIDDVWVNPAQELIIVDYKATAKDSKPTLDAPWQDAYKRQMEIYQWLFLQNNFPVADTGYFVYCNGRKDAAAFDGKLEFDIDLIPYIGKTDWIDQTLQDIKVCLISDKIPPAGEDCDFCTYRAAISQLKK